MAYGDYVIIVPCIATLFFIFFIVLKLLDESGIVLSAIE